MPITQLNLTKEFTDWISGVPEMLAKFLEVAKAFADKQYSSPGVPASDQGPRHFEVGGHVGIEFAGITNDDIDAIKKAYAEAIVKEKAMEYLKGFLAVITIAAA